MARPGLHLTVPCSVCGAWFRQSRSDQTYCSGRCGSAAFRARQVEASPQGRIGSLVACETCGRMFTKKGAGHRFCSPSCTPVRPRATTGEGKGHAKGKEFVPRQTCEVCGASFYAPPVQIIKGGGRFCSNECRGRFVATHPEMFPQTRTRRGHGGRRDDLGGLYVRSAWEANYARYLTWLQGRGMIASWSFEPTTFEFPVQRGSKFYTPDFLVVECDGSSSYHEVKGWMDPRSATKLRRMAKYHPEVRVVLIDKEAYRAIARDVAALIPGWEGHDRLR